MLKKISIFFEKFKLVFLSMPLVFFFGFFPIRVYQIILGKAIEWDIPLFLLFIVIFIIMIGGSFKFIPRFMNTFVVQRFFFVMLYIEDNLYNKDYKQTWKVTPIVFVVALWLFYSKTACYFFFFLVSFFLRLKSQFLQFPLSLGATAQLKNEIVTSDELLGLMALVSRNVFGVELVKKDKNLYLYQTIKARYLSTREVGQALLENIIFVRNLLGPLGAGWAVNRLADHFLARASQPDHMHQVSHFKVCNEVEEKYSKTVDYLRTELRRQANSPSPSWYNIWEKYFPKRELTAIEQEKYLEIASMLKLEITKAPIFIPDKLYKEMENFDLLERERAAVCLDHAILGQHSCRLVNSTEKLKHYTGNEPFMVFLREKDLTECISFCTNFIKIYGTGYYADFLICVNLPDPVLTNLVETQTAFENVEAVMAENRGYDVIQSAGFWSWKADTLRKAMIDKHEKDVQQFEFFCWYMTGES